MLGENSLTSALSPTSARLELIRAGDEQAPTEQRKQLDGRLHPFEVKDLRTHIADHFEAVGNRPVNNFVYPTEHGVPDSVGDTAFHYIYCVSDGVADA